jgi:uncharacterized damage-inducible protein DinB
MDEKEVIVNLFRYNSDVRKKYLDAMEQIDWAEIERNRESSFHSVRGVFLHVLDAYTWWLEYAVPDRSSEYRRLKEGDFTSVESLRKAEKRTDAIILKFVEGIAGNRLDEKFTYHGQQKSFTLTIRNMLLHLVEEELQHRGEINCMFWQMNVDPPVTGYDDWIEELFSGYDK